MRKLTLPGVIVAAVLVLGALFALPAGASTVGDLICGTDDNGAACSDPSPATGDYDGFDPSYHCNNVLYTGPGDNIGDRPGNAYYAVGDPDTSENPVTSPHNAAHEGDCDNDTVADTLGDDDETNDLAYNGNSIILLRAVGYLNTQGGSSPSCPNTSDRNPGCDSGEDAGYVGLGGPSGSATGDADAVDGGLKGNIPVL